LPPLLSHRWCMYPIMVVVVVCAQGLSWKAYAENYPTPGSSQCFTNESSAGLYYRKHVPFISYDNVRYVTPPPPNCASMHHPNACNFL
jgi:hypothetical protein